MQLLWRLVMPETPSLPALLCCCVAVSLCMLRRRRLQDDGCARVVQVSEFRERLLQSQELYRWSTWAVLAQ